MTTTKVLVEKEIDTTHFDVSLARCNMMWYSSTRPLLSEDELAWLCRQPAEDIGSGIICQVVATNHVSPGFTDRSLAIVEVAMPNGVTAEEDEVKLWLYNVLYRHHHQSSATWVMSVTGKQLIPRDPFAF